MIHAYLLSFLALLLLGLSLWLLTRYQASAGIRYYAGFLFGLAVLAAVSGLIYVVPAAVLLVVTRIGYIAGAWTFSMLLLFSWYFPTPSASTPRQANMFWVVPLAFFIPLALWSPDFISGVALWGSGSVESHGHLFFLLPIFIGFCVVWAFKNLVQKITGDRKARTDLVTFSWVLIVTTVLGVVFDIILPATGRPRIPIGIYSSAVLFGLSTYIIARK